MAPGRERDDAAHWRWLGPVALALCIIAGSLLVAHRSHLLTLERRESSDQAHLARLAAGFTADMQAILVAVEAVAQGGPPAESLFTTPGVAAGFLAAADDTPGPALPDPPAVLDLEAPEVRRLLDAARDSGAVQVGPPVPVADGERTVAVAARFAGEAANPVERREQILDWLVVAIDVPALAEAHVSPGHIGRARDSTGPGFDEAVSGLPQTTVDLGGRRFEITAGDPHEVGVRAPSIAIAGFGSLFGLACGVWVALSQRRARRTEAELQARTEQVQLIAEVAPLVQRSLDLAEVLPAVAVQLTDKFGLAGVRLSASTEDMGRVEVFALGDPPAEVAPRLEPPPHLGAGETVSLSLQRAGRSVAELDLLAGRPLHRADLESLGAIGELVASAVVNSSLYASQQRAVARFRELDTLKTVFLGTASHELRTPATAIGGFSSLLADSWERFDEAERRDMAQRIAANARSLSGVVQDLLDFSLLDRGESAVVTQDLDLGRQVESVLDRLSATFSTHEVALDIESGVRVLAEEHGVERVVTNLLTNATKFSPSGSTITVGVRAGDEGGGVLTVADQGPGVPAEERSRIFARFYRGAGDAVLQTRGVGIGLSVVAELVSRVGGSVGVGDAPGGGALFTVWFPSPVDRGDDTSNEDEDEVVDAKTL